MPTAWPLIQVVHLFFFEGVRFPVCPILLQHRNDFNETMPEGDDGGFGDFMASVDALVMGRKTFESVRDMEAPNEKGGETGKLARKAGKLPNREDVPTHLTPSLVSIYILSSIYNIHMCVQTMCIYYITIYTCIYIYIMY